MGESSVDATVNEIKRKTDMSIYEDFISCDIFIIRLFWISTASVFFVDRKSVKNQI